MSFWGCIVKPGVKAKVEKADGDILHLSQACLHNPQDGKNYVQVEVLGNKYAIACLEKGKREHDCFDLFFDPDACTFSNTGKSEVHLTGYFEPDEAMIDMDDDEDSEEEKLVPATKPAIAASGKTSPVATKPASPKQSLIPIPIKSGSPKVAAQSPNASPKMSVQESSDDDEDEEDEEEEFGEGLEEDEEEEDLDLGQDDSFLEEGEEEEDCKDDSFLEEGEEEEDRLGDDEDEDEEEEEEEVDEEETFVPKASTSKQQMLKQAMQEDDSEDEDEDEEEEEDEEEVPSPKLKRKAEVTASESPLKKHKVEAVGDDSAAYIKAVQQFLKQNGKTNIGILGSKVPKPKGITKLRAFLDQNKANFRLEGDCVSAC